MSHLSSGGVEAVICHVSDRERHTYFIAIFKYFFADILIMSYDDVTECYANAISSQIRIRRHKSKILFRERNQSSLFVILIRSTYINLNICCNHIFLIPFKVNGISLSLAKSQEKVAVSCLLSPAETAWYFDWNIKSARVITEIVLLWEDFNQGKKIELPLMDCHLGGKFLMMSGAK